MSDAARQILVLTKTDEEPTWFTCRSMVTARRVCCAVSGMWNAPKRVGRMFRTRLMFRLVSGFAVVTDHHTPLKGRKRLMTV
jgi:hypothetical protein